QGAQAFQQGADLAFLAKVLDAHLIEGTQIRCRFHGGQRCCLDLFKIFHDRALSLTSSNAQKRKRGKSASSSPVEIAATCYGDSRIRRGSLWLRSEEHTSELQSREN